MTPPAFLRIAALTAVISCAARAESLSIALATEALIQHRLEMGMVAGKLRQATIAKMFSDAGCVAEEQKVSRRDGNVICTLPGETTSTIVVGGHFDFVDEGSGIIDDWSGTSLLPSLFEALKNRKRQHTYVFVAFAQEEVGLVGSSAYVKKLPKEQRTLVRAFVNLECLGLTPPKVWASRADKNLLLRLSEVATSTGIQVQGVNVEKVGDDDSHPFISAKIPAITIHSITQETWGKLHSRDDALAAIHPDLYYQAYKLAAIYLAYLDVKSD